MKLQTQIRSSSKWPFLWFERCDYIITTNTNLFHCPYCLQAGDWRFAIILVEITVDFFYWRTTCNWSVCNMEYVTNARQMNNTYTHVHQYWKSRKWPRKKSHRINYFLNEKNRTVQLDTSFAIFSWIYFKFTAEKKMSWFDAKKKKMLW